MKTKAKGKREKGNDSLFPAFAFCLLTCLSLFPSSLFATPDPRFGFVGTGGKAFAQKFGLVYYVLEGNYDSLATTMSSALPANDPAPGYKVIRRVAKLNVRNDGLGQSDAQFQAGLTSYAQSLAFWFTLPLGRKPVFTWYAPNVSALAAAESSQIVTTMRREKSRAPAITGTVWEIGNEPNLFPALLPAQYASLFARYYQIIKGEDASAQVAFGSIFLRETAEDLQPKMEEMLQAALTANGLGSPGQPLFDSVYSNVRNTLSSRIFNLGTLEYLSQCFSAMDASVHPDLITIHVYPYDDRPPVLDKATIRFKLDSLLTSVSSFLNTRGLQPPVWVTEFGNINAALIEATIASQTSDLIDVFAANTHFGNWFYYKPTGADEQFALLSGSAAPLTRLSADSSFNPPDGNFPCARLNSIGAMYYLKAFGQACQDNADTTLPTAIEETGGLPRAFALRIVSADFASVLVFAVPGKSLADRVTFKIRLLDAQGRTARTLMSGAAAPGTYRLPLDGDANMRALASGLYFVEMRAKNFSKALRLPWRQR